MTLRSGSSKSPAPGVQEQQRAEAMSKQRQQQQQQQQAAQAQAAQSQAYASMQMGQYAAQSPIGQTTPNMYNVYSPTHQGAPPPYQQPTGFAQQPMSNMLTAPQQQSHRYSQQPNMYSQGASRGGRQRASTLEQHHTGISPAMQRVMGHLDPTAPIRLQPSPAYYPPPAEGAPESGGSRRRESRGGQNGGNADFIRSLEERSLEDGFRMNNHWQ
jgi:dual specificity protein kinase YAK1